MKPFAKFLACLIISSWIIDIVAASKTSLSQESMKDIGEILETIVCLSALILSVIVVFSKESK